MARLNSYGRTQKVLNASSIHLDEMKLEYAKWRQMLFLTTTPPEEPDIFDHAAIASFDVTNKPRTNLLGNPAFSYRGLARRETPIWWSTRRSETTGTVELSRNALLGTHSVKMTAAQNENCYLHQELTWPFPADSYTFSAWYMSPMPADTISSDADVYGVYLRVMYADATAEMFKASFEIGTDGQWKRLVLTFTATKEIFSIKPCMYLRNADAQTTVLYIGGAQFEVGETATSFSDGAAGIPYVPNVTAASYPVDAYISNGTSTVTEEVVSGSPVSFTAKDLRHLFYVREFHTFWDDAIPHRATTTATSAPPTATQLLNFGWYALGEEARSWSTGWRIVNNKLQQYNLDIPTETVGEFDISEVWLDEDGTTAIGIYDSTQDPGFSRTLETFTFFKNRLWLVCKETEDGVTKRVLKVLYPWSQSPLPIAYDQGVACVHLESRGDVDLGMTTGTADFLASVDGNPDQFLMRVDSSYYLIDLEYDYFTLANRERRAIVRYGYTGTLVTV